MHYVVRGTRGCFTLTLSLRFRLSQQVSKSVFQVIVVSFLLPVYVINAILIVSFLQRSYCTSLHIKRKPKRFFKGTFQVVLGFRP